MLMTQGKEYTQKEVMALIHVAQSTVSAWKHRGILKYRYDEEGNLLFPESSVLQAKATYEKKQWHRKKKKLDA